MCGFAGLLDPTSGHDASALAATAGRMATTLEHRGPDDAGTWVDAHHGVALGFRRLAIVDLTPTGHQPMCSPSERFVLAFNGEVYDHRRLRSELEATGAVFRGTSDTEVLLAGIDEWGVEPALRRANFMGALAVWDRREATLHLARDRVGEKPLVWGWAGDALVFGSELKALRAHPRFRSDLDPAAVASYARLTYVPHPRAIVRDARQLPPGGILTVAAGDLRPGTWPEPRRWWRLDDVVAAGAAGRAAPLDLAGAADAVADLASDAVALRREADVPVGAFLSGGVDSSAVVALLRAGGADVRTFCVAMPDAGLDESAEAAAVARHLGTDHTTIELSVSDALDAVRRLPAMYDEPFADPSALPTHLVASAARREVTVALTGDGGDEVFGGYNRHVAGPSTWRRVRRLPSPARRLAAAGIGRVRPDRWDSVGARLHLPVRNPGDKAAKLAGVLRSSNDLEVARRLLTTWEPAELLAADRFEGEVPTALDGRVPDGLDPVERLLYVDTVQGLPDGMLVKVDRASMACSLEVRPPLLDPRLVELVWHLPRTARVEGATGKRVLREVLFRHVPRELVERPKLGFDPPVDAWLRGPLRTWAEELLAPDALASHGWFEVDPVQRRWREHLDGTRRWDYALWTVLSFQLWWQAWTS